MEDYEITKVGDEYLVHSLKGTARKVHKYISRTYKKGRWYYEYPITGKGYLKKANEAAKEADKWNDRLNTNIRRDHSISGTDGDNLRRQIIRAQEQHQDSKMRSYNLGKARDSLYDYKSKSIKGAIEDALSKRLSKTIGNLTYMKNISDASNEMSKVNLDTMRNELRKQSLKEAEEKQIKEKKEATKSSISDAISEAKKKLFGK